MIGKATLEIRYCVTSGYFWKAAGLAAELAEGHVRETDITLTPVHGGRLEIYVNGTKVYDRKEAGAADFYPSLKEMRKAKDVLAEAIASAPPA
jgi:predicted Rdx family selenoprotein